MDSPARKQREIVSEHIDQTKPAYLVVDRFGGLSEFCRLTGYATSTVHGWMKSGLVPARIHEPSGMSHQAYILACANDNNIEMDASIFIEQPVAA